MATPATPATHVDTNDDVPPAQRQKLDDGSPGPSLLPPLNGEDGDPTGGGGLMLDEDMEGLFMEVVGNNLLPSSTTEEYSSAVPSVGHSPMEDQSTAAVACAQSRSSECCGS